MSTLLPDPGVYHDVPFEEYAAWQCVNESTLGLGDVSPLNFKSAMENREQKESEAFRDGRAIHTYVLENDKFESQYRVDDEEKVKKRAMEIHRNDSGKPDDKYEPPKRLKSTKAWEKAEQEFDDGRELIPDSLHRSCKAIHENFWSNRRIVDAFPEPKSEVSIVFDLPIGMRCKIRVDLLSESAKTFGDLKSTRNIAWFDCDIDDFKYHRKMAFYFDGLFYALGDYYEPWLMPAEKQAPHQVLAAPLAPEEIVSGRQAYQRIAYSIVQSTASGIWPGVPQPDVWRRPKSRRK